MYVSLPLEAEPRRSDLFAKPLKTLDALRRRHPGAVIEQMPLPAETAWPAIARLERMLFQNPRRQKTEDGMQESGIGAKPQAACPEARSPNPESPVGIEILAAARQIGEIEMIAARIKRLMIDERTPPGDIAVVFRSTQETAELVREVFERLGIPAAFESGEPLDRRPALRALANLLQLDLEDWPFDRLLGVLGSNYFQPAWPEWTAEARAEVESASATCKSPAAGRG